MKTIRTHRITVTSSNQVESNWKCGSEGGTGEKEARIRRVTAGKGGLECRFIIDLIFKFLFIPTFRLIWRWGRSRLGYWMILEMSLGWVWKRAAKRQIYVLPLQQHDTCFLVGQSLKNRYTHFAFIFFVWCYRPSRILSLLRSMVKLSSLGWTESLKWERSFNSQKSIFSSGAEVSFKLCFLGDSKVENIPIS